MKSDDRIEPLLVELPIRVKTYDIDFVGHVNNIVYVRWLEDLRLHLLDTHLPLEGLRGEGVVPIIVNTEIHYRRPVLLSDEHVLGRMWIRDFGKAIFYLSAEFKVGDNARCTAQQRGTFVNAHTQRPVRVPVDLYLRFQQERGKGESEG